MKRLLCLLALAALVALPLQAGVSVHVNIGGGFGGYHGYCGPSYGGHGYYGGYRGSYGYGGGYGYGYPIVSYGYGPSYYSSYGAPLDYGYSAGSYPTYAPATYAPPSDAPAAPAQAPALAVTPAVSPSSLAVGNVDAAGFVHSPFTNTAFKVDTYANGQTFYDPVTGQAFTVRKTDTGAKAAAPSAFIPAGRIDEFGYVHSPYSTYFAKVRTEGSSQVYHDPNTGQFFTVVPKATAQHVASAQVVD